MSGKRTKRTRPRSGGRRERRGGLVRFLMAPLLSFIFLLVPFLVALGVASVGYQDQRVREQFEGKRWELPARVFAGAPELFVGAAYDAEGFEWLLQQMKYRRDPQLATQGSYIRMGDEILLRTREFEFWDTTETARELRVQFADGQVILLEAMDSGQAVALLRLDPAQIGSFYPARHEDRLLIQLDQAPEPLLNALFASEDHDFYQHHGVSIRGILRALIANLRAGGIVQGGSTITQQLVKNFYLSSERTWWRKLNEVTMSVILDAHYSKDEILEAYLNEIYLGQDGSRAIHGFGLASQYYFGRTIEELELHHVALLVALVRGPSYYDPYRSPERVLARRNLILDEMASQGFIEPALAHSAASKPLDVVRNPHQIASRYPAFIDLVRRQLQKEYRPEDLTSEGLRIFTTLDVNAQRQLQQAVSEGLSGLEGSRKRGHGLEGAAIMTRRATGEIAALVGSRDPHSSGFNRALDAHRQIGSLFKPVVYLTALEQSDRFTVATPIQDTAIEIKLPGDNWKPKNYDGRQHGTVPLFRALASSYNLATVRLGLEVGVENTARTLKRLGVETAVGHQPSLLLGTATLTPLEVSQMYQTLANDGFIEPIRAIQAVVSTEGKTLQRFGLDVRHSIDATPVYLLNSVLKQVMRSGTARSAYEVLPESLEAAGKTGTTNQTRDSWFAGFTGDYVGVVWVGKDNNQPTGLTGAQGALKLWSAAMKKLSREPLELEKPAEVDLVWVDATGRRTGQGCPSAIRLPFMVGTAPATSSGCEGSSTTPRPDTSSEVKNLF